MFHLEVASREFETQFIKLINASKTQHKIYERLKSTLKKWAEGDYKSDPQLNLIPSLYLKLKAEGHDFSSTPEMVRLNFLLVLCVLGFGHCDCDFVVFLFYVLQTRPNYPSKDPNFVASNQEAEELAKGKILAFFQHIQQYYCDVIFFIQKIL